jgi:hypothetical protein
MKIGIVSGDYLRSDRSPDGQEKWGGAGWARLGQYVDYLRQAGHSVVVGHLWLRGNYLTVQDENDTVHYPDVLLMQRLMHDGLDKSVRIGRASGQVVINDIDDWYWGLDPSNAAYKASHPKYNKIENTVFYRKVVSASDHVTVSTPYLADRVGTFFHGPMTVLQNYVDVGRFTNRTHVRTNTPEVGWAGSTDHRSGDLELLRGVLGPLVDSLGIGLVHGGHLPSSPSFASKVGVHDQHVRCIERVNHAEYPKLLDFDIGIVPLRDIPFNHAKSDIKGLEYAASGIPFIASGLSSYSALHKCWGDESGVFIAKRPKDWTRLVKHLCDYSRRAEYGALLRKHVMSRDILIGAKNILGFLESV